MAKERPEEAREHFANGVLEVTIPVSEHRRGRRLEIEPAPQMSASREASQSRQQNASHA